MKTQKPEEHSEQTDGATDVLNDTAPKSKTAFFITPLGSDNSEIRRATDGLISAVIEPALKNFDVMLMPPHKILNPGNITRQIVRYILDSDLVIANLTGLNANVMYELAIRHAKRKPVIVIAEIGTKLPFDIAAERTIFYTNDMVGVVELTARLNETIPVALRDKNPDNPVYSGLESSIIQQKVDQEGSSIDSYIIDKLDQLADSISYLKTNVTTQPSFPTPKNQVLDQYFVPMDEVANPVFPEYGTTLKSLGIDILGDTKFGDVVFHKITGMGGTLIGLGSGRGTGVLLVRNSNGTLSAARPDMYKISEM